LGRCGGELQIDSHGPDEDYPAMTVTLPAAFESFISQKVASGCYGSAEEVVAESLDLLKHQERWQQAASAKIEEGLRDLNAGRTLTDAESRREMEAFKSRWRAGV
jgi:putative addiction module CopG family antidote